PAEARDLVQFLRGCRASYGLADRPFDIVAGGASPTGPAGRDLVGPLADLGITWWDERMPWGDDLERTGPMLRRIQHGPPRICPRRFGPADPSRSYHLTDERRHPHHRRPPPGPGHRGRGRARPAARADLAGLGRAAHRRAGPRLHAAQGRPAPGRPSAGP